MVSLSDFPSCVISMPYCAFSLFSEFPWLSNLIISSSAVETNVTGSAYFKIAVQFNEEENITFVDARSSGLTYGFITVSSSAATAGESILFCSPKFYPFFLLTSFTHGPFHIRLYIYCSVTCLLLLVPNLL